jgi:hypothetical protein
LDGGFYVSSKGHLLNRKRKGEYLHQEKLLNHQRYLFGLAVFKRAIFFDEENVKSRVTFGFAEKHNKIIICPIKLCILKKCTHCL